MGKAVHRGGRRHSPVPRASRTLLPRGPGQGALPEDGQEGDWRGQQVRVAKKAGPPGEHRGEHSPHFDNQN